MHTPTCTDQTPAPEPTPAPEQTISLDDLVARVSLRLLNPQLDPDGSIIIALAEANRQLATSGDSDAIRQALARQAGLLELASIGFMNKATTAPDASSAEALARVATRASDALLRTLSALYQMTRDERPA